VKEAEEPDPDHVTQILDEFVSHSLMVRENNKYLSLAVMPYSSEFEKQEDELSQSLARAARNEAASAPAMAIAES